MSRIVVCTSCGASIHEDAALCECDRERLEQRIAARHGVFRALARVHIVKRHTEAAVERGAEIAGPPFDRPGLANIVRTIGLAAKLGSVRGSDVGASELLIASRATRGEHDA